MTEHIEPKAVAAPERPGSQIRAALAGFAERVAIPEEIVIVTTALLVGIGTTLFTNVWVSRLFFDLWVGRDKNAETLSI